MYYYRARYYDAKMGRFISEDPIGFAGGDVNLYVMVGNNPVMLVDPYGLGFWDWLCDATTGTPIFCFKLKDFDTDFEDTDGNGLPDLLDPDDDGDGFPDDMDPDPTDPLIPFGPFC